MEEKKRGSSTKKAIVIVCVLVAAAIAAFLLWKFLGNKKDAEEGEKAYVDSVANWMGAGSALGMVDRFSGVVESQETWSVNQNPEVNVKEIHVTTGQEVKAGDPLFTYDVEQYQSQLEQAEIDMERLKNEAASIQETLNQLTKDKAKAAASEQADYTIRIQEQELAQKQKDLEIRSKQMEIDNINSNMENATVVSEIDGVIKSVNKGTTTSNSYDGDSDNSFITVMKTGDLRIKGTVNEQNIQFLSEGTPIIARSRANGTTWSGSVSKIDFENPVQSTGYYGSDSGSSSSKYPFYVELEDSSGLMMGQHVYLEPDYGQDEVEVREGIWLDDYLVDQTDPEHPFVWADNGKGRIEKRAVTLGERDEDLWQVQILDGLTEEDKIAQPMDYIEEGMATGTMQEYYEALENGTFDGGYEETYMDDGEIYEELDSEDGVFAEPDLYEEQSGSVIEEGGIFEESEVLANSAAGEA